MTESRALVCSSCVEWLNDWVEADPPRFLDEYDLSQWMETSMTAATQTFIRYGFTSPRARNDAIQILRALFHEYYLFQQQLAHQHISPNLSAVGRLQSVQQTSQKSAAWHAESRELLTSHEFGAVCYGTDARRASIVAKKCQPEMVLSGTGESQPQRIVFTTLEDGTMSPLKWGWRFEPVSRMVFEQCISQGSVFDGLGRIRHQTHPKLAASPDGLILNGPRCGRLVEIKSPYSRELDGTIPLDYYCQMQLQAEVCDVEAVEYVEVKFKSTPAASVTVDIITASKVPWIGTVCVVSPSDDASVHTYTYEYSPLYPNTSEGLANALAFAPVGIILETAVWYVQDMFHQTVPRNRVWWAQVGLPRTTEFWELVDAARMDGRYLQRSVSMWAGESSADDADNENDNADSAFNINVKEEELK